MTDEPQAPKAAAIYLYRQVDADDLSHVEKIYVRIKVLTDEGRAYANVSIPFDTSTATVKNIEARTIRPDGSIVNFDGVVYEKPIARGQYVRSMSKTFTLSDVQTGSIIEYRYTVYSFGNFFNSHWILSADLYTKLAKFSLVPYRGYVLRRIVPAGLPPGTEGPAFDHGTDRLTAHDIPAFVTEEFMPPADELKMRVDFAYLSDKIVDKDVDAFWARKGKVLYKFFERFADDRRAMQEAVAETVSPGDSPEQKLRKLYSRAQQIRNLSFERAKTTQETDREGAKDNDDVKGVWKHGYGSREQISSLFLALARAADCQADLALAPLRSRFFFDPKLEETDRLRSTIVIVKLGGRDVFLDPGIPAAPFGELPWGETAVKALRLDQNGGTWVATPLPDAAKSRIERKATLHLSSDGTLEGKVTYTFTGLEALSRRLEMRNQDEASRKRFLEGEITEEIPGGSEITLANTPDWTSADPALVAVFDVKVPGWATVGGRRAVLPMGLFANADKHIFEHAARTHAVYFPYPHQAKDDVAIELPTGWQATSLPQLFRSGIQIADFESSAEKGSTGLQLHRELSINRVVIPLQLYDLLRDFYGGVRVADADQAVLSIASKPAPRK